MTRDKPPPPLLVKTRRGLFPASAWDAELFDEHPFGTRFVARSTTKRSVPHMKTYWKTLNETVKATGLWPTRQHLHEALKASCGYAYQIEHMKTHEMVTIADSIAFDAMTQVEFRVYFDQAMQVLAETVGFDPLEYMESA